MSLDDLRTFIQTELLGDPDFALEADQDLLLSEILDSLSVTRLVAHIEAETGREIPPEDVTLENFQSLQKISDYLAQGES